MINNIDKLILKEIIQSPKPVSGTYLSNICQVSINTIRKEINIINDFLADYGCYIDMKIAIGYSFIIEDANIANPFIAELLKNINTFGYLNTHENAKSNYIIRRLLSSSSMIPVESFVNELYFSKSTVLRNIDKANEYLVNFNLAIKNKRNGGFYIQGSEWNKRMCLIHQHKILKHSTYDVKLETPVFSALFLEQTNTFNEIRKIIFNTLVNYPEISISQINIPIVINFIILCHTRQQLEGELIFTKQQLETVENLPVYAFAIELTNLLKNQFDFSYSQKTIYAIAFILSGCWKINKNHVDITPYLNKYRKLISDFIDYACTKYDIRYILDHDIIYENLSLFLEEQSYRSLFKVISDEETFRTSNSIGIFSSDLVALFSHFLKNNYNIHLSKNSLNRLYPIINYAVFNYQEEFDKKRFAVISRYGAYYAQNIASRVYREFQRNIEKIDVYEFSNIPTINLDNYDAILSDINDTSILKNIKVIDYDFQASNLDFEHINNFFSTSRESYISKYLKKEDFIIGNHKNKKDIFTTLYKSIHPTNITQDEWIADCIERDNLLTFKRQKGITLITNFDYHSNSPIFKVIVNKNAIYWDDENLYHIFIYYHRGKGTDEEIQIISYLIKLFLKKPESFLNSLSSLSYDDLIELIKNYNENG